MTPEEEIVRCPEYAEPLDRDGHMVEFTVDFNQGSIQYYVYGQKVP